MYVARNVSPLANYLGCIRTVHVLLYRRICAVNYCNQLRCLQLPSIMPSRALNGTTPLVHRTCCIVRKTEGTTWGAVVVQRLT